MELPEPRNSSSAWQYTDPDTAPAPPAPPMNGSSVMVLLVLLVESRRYRLRPLDQRVSSYSPIGDGGVEMVVEDAADAYKFSVNGVLRAVHVGQPQQTDLEAEVIHLTNIGDISKPKVLGAATVDRKCSSCERDGYR